MTADTRVLIQAFRRALERAAGEPVLSPWCGYIGSFPDGCCELASQMLVRYLMEHNDRLFPYVIGMEWRVNAQDYGHVIVALNGDYTDLTLDQFDGYDDWIVAEPVESGGQIAAFIQKVRDLDGTFTTRERTFDGIADDAEKLYGWLKATADSLLPATAQPWSAPGALHPVCVNATIFDRYRLISLALTTIPLASPHHSFHAAAGASIQQYH
ncbi:hypothetical protein EOY42_25540 [Salmonella enterica]|nr:hypothetical protein [Salmonella enterica]EBD7601891.1 hypothetical protein [Salmonella enterica]EHF8057731.1 hypothetical protein [Salmonella enterica subsp. enterica serovar Oranienburg]EHJ8970310.1 hypothetical protein [Salmonella enterica]